MGSRGDGRAERNASISKGLSGRGDRSFSCLLVRVCWELCPRHPHLPTPTSPPPCLPGMKKVPWSSQMHPIPPSVMC